MPVQRICQPDMAPAEDGACVPVGYWGGGTVAVFVPADELPATGTSDRTAFAAFGVLLVGAALTVTARRRQVKP